MNVQMGLQIAQIVVAVLLTAVISIQGKGAGLSSTFGGGALYSTRRGAEKVVFYATIVLGVIFAALSILSLVL
jgi:preprotein translocase subunit SecG